MRFTSNRVFKRQFKKLDRKMQDKVEERLLLLAVDASNPLLNTHKLESPYETYCSINITGDHRLIYRRIGTDTIFLRAIGTHHELYGS